MARVFISYSRKDEEFVRRLATDLDGFDADVWIDVEDIRSGDDWSDSIQQALDDCQVMILVISPDSMASSNVADEWKYFRDEGKPVIPVLLEPARVHFQLRRIQYVDFHSQDYDTAFGQLHSELRRKGIALTPLSDADALVDIPPQDPLPPIREQLVDRLSDIPSHYWVIGAVGLVLMVVGIILAGSGIIGSGGDDDDTSPPSTATPTITPTPATPTRTPTTKPSNVFPAVEPVSDQVMSLDETRDVPYVASDPDGDDLTPHAESADDDVVVALILFPGKVQLTATGLGMTTVTISADDGHGGIATTDFTVIVHTDEEASPAAPPPSTPTAATPTPDSMTDLPPSRLVFTLERSAETVAICPNQAADLRTLQLRFEDINEYYTLGADDMFGDQAATTQAGACWCIQRADSVYPVPAYCVAENTIEQPRRSTGEWRNEDITVKLGDDVLGMCEAQPDNRETYTCIIDSQ
jgi:hypothetical protein